MDEKRVLCEFKLDKSITLGFQNVSYTFKIKKAFELCFNIGQLCTLISTQPPILMYTLMY